MKVILEQDGKRLVLPITPAEIQETFEININQTNLVSVGDIATPGNRKLNTIPLSFNIFPYNLTNTNEFNNNPEYYIETIKKFMDKPIKLTITGTPIGGKFIIQQFVPVRNYSNGMVSCTMQLLEQRDITYNPQSGSLVDNNEYTGNNNRPPSPAPNPNPGPQDNWKTVTIGAYPHDCLWNIAMTYLGNGSRYGEIWEWNKPMRSGNPSLVYAGEQVKIKNAIR